MRRLTRFESSQPKMISESISAQNQLSIGSHLANSSPKIQRRKAIRRVSWTANMGRSKNCSLFRMVRKSCAPVYRNIKSCPRRHVLPHRADLILRARRTLFLVGKGSARFPKSSPPKVLNAFSFLVRAEAARRPSLKISSKRNSPGTRTHSFRKGNGRSQSPSSIPFQTLIKPSIGSVPSACQVCRRIANHGNVCRRVISTAPALLYS